MIIQDIIQALVGDGEGDERQQERRAALRPRPPRWYRRYNPTGSGTHTRRRWMHRSHELPGLWYTDYRDLRLRKRAKRAEA